MRTLSQHLQQTLNVLLHHGNAERFARNGTLREQHETLWESNETFWGRNETFRERKALHFWERNALYALASFSIFPDILISSHSVSQIRVIKDYTLYVQIDCIRLKAMANLFTYSVDCMLRKLLKIRKKVIISLYMVHILLLKCFSSETRKLNATYVTFLKFFVF